MKRTLIQLFFLTISLIFLNFLLASGQTQEQQIYHALLEQFMPDFTLPSYQPGN